MIFGVLTGIQKRAVKKVQENAEVIAYRSKSGNILKQPEVRAALCQLLNAADTPELLEAEKKIQAVKAVTSVLTLPSISSDISVDADARLFGYVAYELLSVGLDRYCV